MQSNNNNKTSVVKEGMVTFIPLPLYPRGNSIMVPIEYESGWAPVTVWTFGEEINI
jgi:hypothetical protein